jgi:imidazolonepropionase-like amidohydrolase
MIRTCAIAILALSSTAAAAETIALTHVRIIDGTGAAPVEDATIVMDDGRIRAAGRDARVPAGARILDRRGRTALPALISDHSHVGQVGGTDTGAKNYTRAAITAALAQYRRYGIGTVVALGNNGPLFDVLRREAHAGALATDLFGVDQGIGVPDGAPPQSMLKVGPDQLFRPATAEEARDAVRRMAASGTDLVKVWLDDFGGAMKVKMAPDVYGAVIDESHRRGLRVAAHVHDLADAQAIVAAGADILAHGIRDRPVPAAFAAELKRRGIWYIATLQLDEATTAWAEQQPWTRTPFARAALSPALATQVDDPAWRARTLADPKAAAARASLAMNLRNLKTLEAAGVRIGFGTDSGASPVRVPGIAEHRELALTVQAGIAPLRAIRIATHDAAALLALSDRGTIAAGKRADLLVVAGDPARDIAAVDHVVETWENGHAVSGPLSPLN